MPTFVQTKLAGGGFSLFAEPERIAVIDQLSGDCVIRDGNCASFWAKSDGWPRVFLQHPGLSDITVEGTRLEIMGLLRLLSIPTAPFLKTNLG